MTGCTPTPPAPGPFTHTHPKLLYVSDGGGSLPTCHIGIRGPSGRPDSWPGCNRDNKGHERRISLRTSLFLRTTVLHLRVGPELESRHLGSGVGPAVTKYPSSTPGRQVQVSTSRSETLRCTEGTCIPDRPRIFFEGSSGNDNPRTPRSQIPVAPLLFLFVTSSLSFLWELVLDSDTVIENKKGKNPTNIFPSVCRKTRRTRSPGQVKARRKIVISPVSLPATVDAVRAILGLREELFLLSLRVWSRHLPGGPRGVSRSRTPTAAGPAAPGGVGRRRHEGSIQILHPW